MPISAANEDDMGVRELSRMGTGARARELLKGSLVALVLAPVVLFALAALVQWWKEGHNHTAWHHVAAGAFVPELIAAAAMLLLLIVAQVARAHVQVHHAHRERAEAAEHREADLIAEREHAQVTPAHETQLRQLLEGLKLDVSEARACNYGDAGGTPDRRESITAHFGELAAELDAWDAAVARLAKAPEELRTAIELWVAERGISDQGSLAAVTDKLAVLTRDRALAGELHEIVGLGIEDLSHSAGRGGVTLIVGPSDLLVIDRMPEDGEPPDPFFGAESDDRFPERVHAAKALLQALFAEAQRSVEAAEVTDAQKALAALRPSVLQSLERHLMSFPVRRRAPECPFCQTQAPAVTPRAPTLVPDSAPTSRSSRS